MAQISNTIDLRDQQLELISENNKFENEMRSLELTHNVGNSDQVSLKYENETLKSVIFELSSELKSCKSNSKAMERKIARLQNTIRHLEGQF